jgi:hypothetical protein
MAARGPDGPQPRGARAPGRHRQLVRAPAGQALRRGPGGLRDDLELRDPLREPQDARRAPRHRSPRARGGGGWAGFHAAVRPGPRRHAHGRRARGRGGRRPDRPQHGLPGPEGLQDRRRRRAAQGPRHGRRRRARRRGGLRPARDRQAARRGLRRRAPPRRGGRRGRHHLPPAHGQGPPQGPPRLRPGRRARPGASRAGDHLGRHAGGGAHPLGVRVHGRRGDHARPRLAREPVAVRAGARHPRARSGPGSSTAPRSIWATRGPPATYASSTRGTSSAWARRPPCRTRCSARRRSPSSAS